MGTRDKGGREDAVVCWHCGTLVPLKVKMLDGRRVVICHQCGKTNDLHSPSGLFRRPGCVISDDS